MLRIDVNVPPTIRAATSCRPTTRSSGERACSRRSGRSAIGIPGATASTMSGAEAHGCAHRRRRRPGRARGDRLRARRRRRTQLRLAAARGHHRHAGRGAGAGRVRAARRAAVRLRARARAGRDRWICLPRIGIARALTGAGTSSRTTAAVACGRLGWPSIRETREASSSTKSSTPTNSGARSRDCRPLLAIWRGSCLHRHAGRRESTAWPPTSLRPARPTSFRS